MSTAGAPKLGIGTTSPNSELDVFGDIRITNKNGSNPTDAGSLIFEEAGDNWGSSLFGFRINLEGSSNYLNFQSANLSTIKDVLTLTRDTSYVGINKTDPSHHLHVVGKRMFTGGVTVGDSSADTFTTRGHTHLATLGNNVGIGTTGPDAKLEVRSTSNPQIRASYNDSHYLDIYASNGTGYIKSDSRFRVSSSTGRYIFHGNANSTGRAEMFLSAGGDIANKRMSSFLNLLRGYEGKD